jgi:hypothetical protein
MSVKPAAFRKLALSQTGAVESAHCGHPDFRIGGKVFASLGAPTDDWAMVKLTPEQQQSFVAAAAEAFQAANGAWGRSGCTMVNLPAADRRVVKSALELASETAAPKIKSRIKKQVATERAANGANRPSQGRKRPLNK